MNIKIALATGMAAMAALTVATPALAAPAIATAALNVRTGPGTEYVKVDALFEGEEVDVAECKSGWCYVQHDGADGWVAAKYLADPDEVEEPEEDAPPPPKPSKPVPKPQPADPDFGFGFSFGSDGSFSFGIGQQPQPSPSVDAVCFYEGPNYSGAGLCIEPGSSFAKLNAWNDRISSVRVYGEATAEVCSDYNFYGACAQIVSSRAQLNSALNNRISSLEAF